MKKIIIAIIAILTAVILNVYVNAEELNSTVTTTPSAVTNTSVTTISTPETTSGAVNAPSTPASSTSTAAQQAGITPDNFFYPLERFVESIQVALTYSSEGKAELLVKFANERLAEAQVMTQEKKLELVKKVMNDYINIVNKANEEAQKAPQDSPNTVSVLSDIKLSEDSAGNTIISAVGVIPQQYVDALKNEVAKEALKTAAIQTMSLVRDSIKKVEDIVKAAR